MLTTAATGLALVLVFLALLWAFQRRLIYLPYGRVDDPASLGLAGAESFAVTAADGVTIRGWYVPANTNPPRFWVVVFPGNAGNRSHRAPLAAALRNRGVATVLFDYRGYGDSEGRPTEEGLALDALAVREHIAARLGADSSRIVYFGESLGAAVALRLAIDHPPLALILRSPFTSLVDVGSAAYPFLPVSLLLRERYPSIDIVSRLTSSLLVIIGRHDEVIPVEQSERLYNAAQVPKRLVRLDVSGHNHFELLAGRELVDAVVEFVAIGVGTKH
ncbi:MAG TPA: alpha/beta hydrolase [Gemmatimonadaceae bacterium]